MSTSSPISGRTTSVYLLYQYVPNLAPAIIAIAIFTMLTAAHFFRLFKTRMWFCMPFVIGGICKCGHSCAKFPFSQPLVANTTPLYSRTNWLYRSRSRSLQQQIQTSLHHAIGPHPRCTGSLCSHDLHDSRTSDADSSQRKALDHPSEMANQDLCDWRCPVLLHTRRWRRHHGQRRPQ